MECDAARFIQLVEQLRELIVKYQAIDSLQKFLTLIHTNNIPKSSVALFSLIFNDLYDRYE